MLLNWSAIVLLILGVSGVHSLAQTDSDEGVLRINRALVDPVLCPGEQAREFYRAMHAFQEHIDAIPQIADTDKLLFWLRVYNGWLAKEWIPKLLESCDGVKHQWQTLNRLASYSILHQLIHLDGQVPEADALQTLGEMAAADLAALEEDKDAQSDLRINLQVTELEPCSNERALEFYTSIEGYERETEKLALIRQEDWIAIRIWFAWFDTWRLQAWEAYYEDACGETLPIIRWLETLAYEDAMAQVTGGAGSDIVTMAIQNMRNVAAEDIKLIAEMSHEQE